MFKSVRFLTLMLFFIVNISSVHAFRWPVVNYVQNPEVTGPTSAKYRGTWVMIEIPDELDGPGYSTIGLGHRHRSNGIETTGALINTIKVSETKCPGFLFSCLGEQWEKYYNSGASFVIEHTGGENGSECVGVVSSSGDSASSPWDQIKIPLYEPAKCIGTAPIPHSCTLNTPSVNFKYDVIKASEAVGAIRTESLNVICTGDIKYNLRLDSTMNYIPLSNGMNAEITTDNKTPLGSVINGVEGDNTVNLTATLSGNPSKLGDFMGSGVLLLAYP